MPEPTPVVDELRTAAATLRARAAAVEPDAAILRGVPWETESCDAGCQCIVSQTEPGSADMARVGRYIADAESPELAAWIALMDPGMGPLLADLLDGAASHWPIRSGAGSRLLAVARHINAKEQPA